jgi:hypothetical protein
MARQIMRARLVGNPQRANLGCTSTFDRTITVIVGLVPAILVSGQVSIPKNTP